MASQHEPLPDRALALLASERELAPVDDERRARMLSRMDEAIGAPRSLGATKVAAAALVAPVAETATDAIQRGTLAALVRSKIAIGVLAFGAGAGTGVSIYAVVQAPPARPVAPSSTAAATNARPLLPIPPIVDAPSPSADVSATASASALPPSPSVAPPSTPPSSSASANARRERALIEQARMAVLHGDKASALSALRAHAAEFPDGQHREERETLKRRAEALP